MQGEGFSSPKVTIWKVTGSAATVCGCCPIYKWARGILSLDDGDVDVMSSAEVKYQPIRNRTKWGPV